jgi:hypothetical protein
MSVGPLTQLAYVVGRFVDAAGACCRSVRSRGWRVLSVGSLLRAARVGSRSVSPSSVLSALFRSGNILRSILLSGRWSSSLCISHLMSRIFCSRLLFSISYFRPVYFSSLLCSIRISSIFAFSFSIWWFFSWRTFSSSASLLDTSVPPPSFSLSVWVSRVTVVIT